MILAQKDFPDKQISWSDIIEKEWLASTNSNELRKIVADLNDTESGNFMTLFYLTIDIQNRKMKWVRVGHDPAIFYNPATDTFDELQGKGVALGVERSWRYDENEKTGLLEGQIIFIGTDGVWETTNAQQQMFGKAPIFEIIRQNSKAQAEDILRAIISALNRFRGDLIPEDDVTLMVIKIGEGHNDCTDV